MAGASSPGASYRKPSSPVSPCPLPLAPWSHQGESPSVLLLLVPHGAGVGFSVRGLEAGTANSLVEGGGGLATNKVSFSSPDSSDLFSSRPGPLEAHVLGRAAPPRSGQPPGPRPPLRAGPEGRPASETGHRKEKSAKHPQEQVRAETVVTDSRNRWSVTEQAEKAPRKERGRGDPERHR